MGGTRKMDGVVELYLPGMSCCMVRETGRLYGVDDGNF